MDQQLLLAAIARLESKVDRVETKVDSSAADLADKIDRVAQDQSRLHTRVSVLEYRQGNSEETAARVQRLETDMSALSTALAEFRGVLSELKDLPKAMETRVQNLEKEQAAFSAAAEQLKDLPKKIEDMRLEDKETSVKVKLLVAASVMASSALVSWIVSAAST
jgi:predicted nuclease with TOPRIM domain